MEFFGENAAGNDSPAFTPTEVELRGFKREKVVLLRIMGINDEPCI